MFDGATFDAAQDGKRLKSQLGRVKELLKDGQWRSLYEISAKIPGSSEAGISARLRDLRKPKFGGYLVEKKREKVDGGKWLYRLQLVPGSQESPVVDRLTNADMVTSLKFLRRVYKQASDEEMHSVKKLGRWLAANVQG